MPNLTSIGSGPSPASRIGFLILRGALPRNLLAIREELRFARGVQIGSTRTLIVIILALAILAVIGVVAREIHRAVHPRNKAVRKRKRRTF